MSEKPQTALGKVIRIISDSRIIVDVGENQLTIGDDLLIFTQGEEIFDLDGNSLGLYENIKDTVTVIQTASEYSICAKYTKEVVSSLSVFASMMSAHTEQKEVPMNIEQGDIQPLLINEDCTIHLGDFVRKA